MEDNLNSFRPKYCSSQRRELIFCMQPYLNPTKWNMEEILKNLTMKDNLNFLVLRAAFPEPFFVYLLEGTGMSKWCSLLIKNNVTNQALIYIFSPLVKTEAEKGHPDAGSCFLVSWSCLVPLLSRCQTSGCTSIVAEEHMVTQRQGKYLSICYSGLFVFWSGQMYCYSDVLDGLARNHTCHY